MSTHFLTTRLAAPRTGFAALLLERAGGWMGALIRYRAFRAAYRELMALDDRMLQDIGISRTEITSALLDVTGERRRRL